MEDISEKNRKELENIEDEVEKMKRVTRQKRNVWTWREKTKYSKQIQI